MHEPMHELLHKTISAMWLLWLIYWIVSARQTKIEEKRESRLSRWLHSGPILIGAAILTFPDMLPPALTRRQFTEYETVYWLSAALVALGLGFACLARASLGGNWSAAVTLKQDHDLIRTGPYRYVRHPIYTGLLLALFGTALETGAWRGIIGFALIALAIAYKYRTEERFLESKFGEDYRRYKAEVPALVPFLTRPVKSTAWP
jgi:protein-S-isoprenylcysteine O-methyltransferase Ste14